MKACPTTTFETFLKLSPIISTCIVKCYGLLKDCADPCTDYYFFSKYLDKNGKKAGVNPNNPDLVDTCFNVLRYVSWYCIYGDGANQPIKLKANITAEISYILSQQRKKRFVPESVMFQVTDIHEFVYNKTEYVYNELVRKIYPKIDKKLDYLAWKLGAERFDFEFRKNIIQDNIYR